MRDRRVAAVIALVAVAVLLLPAPAFPLESSTVRVQTTVPTGWANVTGAVAPPAVGGGMMAYDSKADLFIQFGGSTGDPTNATWALDPKTAAWRELRPAASPPARVDGMFVYDDRADAFVLFGGWYEPADEVYLRYGDTWVFYLANDTWVQAHPTTSPSPRSDSGVAYDPRGDLLLLFGGFNGSYLGDTWTYNFAARNWSPLAGASAPSPRADGRIAYDPATDAFYLFGGNDYSGPNFTFHHLADTWRFSLATRAWSELAPSVAPGARDYTIFAADPRAGEIFSFGGFGDREVLGDFWAFNTTDLTWRNLTTPGAPNPRMAGVGGYTPVEDLFIVFSGGNLTAGEDDTWFFHFPGPLMVLLTAPTGGIEPGAAVAFHAQVLGGSGLYSLPTWDFGDGARATAADTTHAFASPGTYTVRVRATDTLGDAANVTTQITVTAPLPGWVAPAGVAAVAVAAAVLVLWMARRRRGARGP